MHTPTVAHQLFDATPPDDDGNVHLYNRKHKDPLIAPLQGQVLQNFAVHKTIMELEMKLKAFGVHSGNGYQGHFQLATRNLVQRKRTRKCDQQFVWLNDQEEPRFQGYRGPTVTDRFSLLVYEKMTP